MALTLAAAVVYWPTVRAEDEDTRRGLEAAVEMRQVLAGIPTLRGDRWQKMSHDEKLAFLSGAGHVVSIEDELMARYPELMVDNFSLKAGDALLGKTADSIIAQIDSFYQNSPDKLAQPVMRVLWDTLIRPNLKTGIAGRPL
jgi:hypothetical protein